MKRLVSIVVVVLVAASMLLPLVPAVAQPARTPHQDPATAATDFDIALPLLLHYADVLSLLAEGKFTDMRSLMAELDVDRADLPDDIRYVMETYNGLLDDLATSLDRLERLIPEAELLIDEGRLVEARRVVNEAKVLVDEAGALLDDVQEATDQLIRLLGPLAPPESADAVKDAEARLKDAVARVEALEARLEALYVETDTDLRKKETISPTELSLTTDKSHVWVWERVTASGFLRFTRESGGPLPQRTVVIYVDGVPVAEVVTDDAGWYEHKMYFNFQLVPEASIQASYTPEGKDVESYLPSTSPEVKVEVRRYPTELTLEVSDTTPWIGDNVTASGVLTSPDEEGKVLPGREIEIMLDGEVVDRVTTAADGSYQGSVSIPHQYIASRKIQARYPWTWDDYAPSPLAEVDIQVQFYTPKLTLNLDNTKPWVGETITASGVLTSPDEGGVGLAGREVSILLDGVVVGTVTTQADGSYQGTVTVSAAQVPRAYIQASYEPEGEDFNKYTPSESPVVEVEVKRYPTELTLDLSSTTPWVGDSVIASGFLTSPEEGGIGVPGEKVSILLDGVVVKTVVTQADGTYQGEITIPYQYVSSRSLQARYASTGGRYDSCSSPVVPIQVQFYTPALTLNLDNTKPWVGENITASGMLTSPDEGGIGLAGRQVSILLNGVVMGTVTTQADGSYQGVITIPPRYVSSQTVEARYASVGDKYAPCSSPVVPIEVQFCTPTLTLGLDNTKPWVGESVTASGMLTSPDEGGVVLPGREVSILLNGVVVDTVTTQADGSYEGTVPIPYKYVSSQSVQASYTSVGDRYTSCSSAVMPIEVQFYTPSLTLNLDDTEPWAGKVVVVSGVLTSPQEGEKPLAGRDIHILVDGLLVGSASTGADGLYSYELTMPDFYVPEIAIQATYVTVADVYGPASSPVVKVRVRRCVTELTLITSGTEVWVGDDLGVSGILMCTEQGLFLGGRDITILLGGQAAAFAVTEADGTYEATVRMPTDYVDSQVLEARYTPRGGDEATYNGTSSGPVPVEVLFCETLLGLDVPEIAYPGLPLRIQGEIIYTAECPLAERTVRVYLDGEVIAGFYAQGAFEHEVTLYPGTMAADELAGLIEGEHELRVQVQPGLRYTGAQQDLTITVRRESLSVQIQGMAVTSLPKKLHLSGRVVSGLPLLEGALVTVYFRDDFRTVSATADGEFEVEFNVPFDSMVMGSQKVTVSVEPLGIWHIPTEEEFTVFVVDAINLGLLSVAFLFVGVVVYTYTRGRRGRAGYEEPEPPAPVLPYPSEVSETAGGVEGPVGYRDRILRAYAAAVRVVEITTDVKMQPQVTMREFLGIVLPLLDGSGEAFKRLTQLSEKAAYSPREPGEAEALDAEGLALEVGGALGGRRA